MPLGERHRLDPPRVDRRHPEQGGVGGPAVAGQGRRRLLEHRPKRRQAKAEKPRGRIGHLR
jgi:hypothetical protein